MLKERQKTILNSIIEEHIKTGQAIGSKLLAKTISYPKVSPATIRNDMSMLEEQGFISQPHTSAGRVPTEKAYQYYVETSLPRITLAKRQKQWLKEVVMNAETNHGSVPKYLAKALAELSEQAVIVAFSKNNLYYTGIGNLLAKPEFQNMDDDINVGQVIDHFDEVLPDLFDEIRDMTILLGHDNPVSSWCGLVAMKYQGRENPYLVTIVGPMRMDYAYNRALLEEMTDYFCQY